MKFSQVKLLQSIKLHGTEITYFQEERHKCQMELKDNYILFTTNEECLLVPLNNVIYAKLAETNELVKPVSKPLLVSKS